MEQWQEILEACPLFDGIGIRELGAMLRCLGAKIVQTPKGSSVFREGEEAIHVGIVLRGSVHMIREDYYGNRSIVAHMGPAQLFGETYACAGIGAYPVSVTAHEDSVCMLLDCRRITRSCTNACAFHSRIIFNLLRLVANKNLVFDKKIQVTSRRTTREKLMTYLLAEAKEQGSSTFTIPYDRQALADYLEVDRSGLSVEIGKLRKEGTLDCEKSTFRLL